MSGLRETVDAIHVVAFRARRKLIRRIRRKTAPQMLAHDQRVYRRQCAGMKARVRIEEFRRTVKVDGCIDFLTSDEAAAVLAKADQACRHEFDLLGSGPTLLGNPIAWHRDFKTGFEWSPQAHHLEIAWDAVPPGTDIKVPWELSRCQHFAALALADRLEGNGRFKEELKRQLGSWIEANPCGYGVNWVCTMDVGIRAVNWLMSLSVLSGGADENESFADGVVESLWCHGRHIMRNLEWNGPRSDMAGNHFLADLCGLFAIGVLFRETGEGERWLAFALEWFEKEINRQVFSDGVLFETSTSYHRLSHEMFLWADGMADRIGRPFSEYYTARLERMGTFVKCYTAPSGLAAQFGDNDGGRLISVGIEELRDHRYLYTDRCGFGGQSNRRLLLADGRGAIDEPSGAFRDGGFFFGAVGSGWLGVRAGAVTHGGAHAHCDQLSFVLTIEGADVIVDPGTGVYTADVRMRNDFRASFAHNAPRVNDLDANHFSGGMQGLFQMSDDTRAELVNWSRSSDAIEFRGRHFGYSRMIDGCLVERTLRMEHCRLEVRDVVRSLRTGDRVRWNFRLDPGVDAYVTEGGASAT